MDSSQNLRSGLKLISDSLQAYPERSITGARLHHLISENAPLVNIRESVGMPTGQGALSRFVQEYLSSCLIPDGSQGADVVYAIRNSQSSVEQPALAAVWSTIASPNSKYCVVLEPDGMRLTVQKASEQLKPGRLPIKSITADELTRIRDDFIKSLDEPQKSTIQEISDQSESYGEWINKMRATLPKVAKNWAKHRREQIKTCFIVRLDTLGLGPQDQQLLLSRLNESQRAGYLARKTPVLTSSNRHGPDRTQRTTGMEASFLNDRSDLLGFARSLAHSAIDEMGHDDLRSIKIPLGAILDSMASKI